MLHRLRYAMHHGTINKMSGTIEADETFISGKARFMHKGRRDKMIKRRGPVGKEIVFLGCSTMKPARFTFGMFRRVRRKTCNQSSAKL